MNRPTDDDHDTYDDYEERRAEHETRINKMSLEHELKLEVAAHAATTRAMNVYHDKWVEQGDRAAKTESRVKELEAEVARLREALRECYGHTACAVTQSIDSDDQIIIGHCRDAAAVARAALRGEEDGR